MSRKHNVRVHTLLCETTGTRIEFTVSTVRDNHDVSIRTLTETMAVVSSRSRSKEDARAFWRHRVQGGWKPGPSRHDFRPSFPKRSKEFARGFNDAKNGVTLPRDLWIHTERDAAYLAGHKAGTRELYGTDR